MSAETPDIPSLIAARREAATASLQPITREELMTLEAKLFPQLDHPWQHIYDVAIHTPTAQFFSGIASAEVSFVWSPTLREGLWYRTRPPTGMGPIPKRGLAILAEIRAEQQNPHGRLPS